MEEIFVKVTKAFFLAIVFALIFLANSSVSFVWNYGPCIIHNDSNVLETHGVSCTTRGFPLGNVETDIWGHNYKWFWHKTLLNFAFWFTISFLGIETLKKVAAIYRSHYPKKNQTLNNYWIVLENRLSFLKSRTIKFIVWWAVVVILSSITLAVTWTVWVVAPWINATSRLVAIFPFAAGVFVLKLFHSHFPLPSRKRPFRPLE